MELKNSNFFQNIHVLQAAYPERVAQIHVINSPLILHALMSFFRPFLKEKIRKRVSIFMVQNEKSMHSEFDHS